MPARDSKLISRLRWYDFRQGTGPLRGAWGDRALQALVTAFEGRGNPQIQAHRVLGMALAADEDFKAAIEHLREVARLDPSNPRAHIDLGNVLQHHFEYKAATAEYREAVKLAPESPEAHAALALALANTDLGQSAVEEFSEALRLRPNFPMAQAGLAYVLSQQLGRVDEAIAAYQKALELDPRLAQALDGLARTEAEKQAAADRLAERRKSAQENPNQALPHADLGVDQARAGQVEGAVQELRRAVALEPGMGRAHADLALLLFLRKEYAAAWQEAQSAEQNGFPAPADLSAILRSKSGQAQ